jgi:hypothetical protein
LAQDDGLVQAHFMFQPGHWYWLADDGRVFSSERQLTVNESDQGYIDWCATGRKPTRWPVDDAGQQTDEILKETLAVWGDVTKLKGM